MSIVPKSTTKPSTFNLTMSPTIQKSRIPVHVKKFVPNQELMDLANDIRSLESHQIRHMFTYGRVGNKDNVHRCVMGALAVEKYGALDDYNDISRRIHDTPILMQYWHYLASMNNSGSSFAEIADWVEGKAKALGTWV